jgi:hypothetical protein
MDREQLAELVKQVEYSRFVAEQALERVRQFEASLDRWAETLIAERNVAEKTIAFSNAVLARLNAAMERDREGEEWKG